MPAFTHLLLFWFARHNAAFIPHTWCVHVLYFTACGVISSQASKFVFFCQLVCDLDAGSACCVDAFINVLVCLRQVKPAFNSHTWCVRVFNISACGDTFVFLFTLISTQAIKLLFTSSLVCDVGAGSACPQVIKLLFTHNLMCDMGAGIACCLRRTSPHSLLCIKLKISCLRYNSNAGDKVPVCTQLIVRLGCRLSLLPSEFDVNLTKLLLCNCSGSSKKKILSV